MILKNEHCWCFEQNRLLVVLNGDSNSAQKWYVHNTSPSAVASALPVLQALWPLADFE